MNKIFQWIWFFIVRPLIRVDDNAIGIMTQYNRILWQFKLAKLFGGVEVVVLGDSNGAALNNYKAMKQFNKIAVNISKGKTIAHDWILFFQSDNGRVIYDWITKVKLQLINIGGNYSLLNQMDKAETGLVTIHKILPYSYNCTIPPLYYDVIDKLDGDIKTKSMRIAEINQLNNWIRNIWKIRCIDLHLLFDRLGDEKVIPGVLKDIVHYSTQASIFICKVLNRI